MSEIVFTNVNKKYGSKEVLKNVNIKVDNEFLFLAGKNGSGKTTMLKCALELLSLNDGSVTYDGKSIDDVREDVAVVFDEPKLYMDFSGMKNIKIFNQGYLRDKENLHDILDFLELSSELLNRKVRTYSLGQRHRLAVAIALIKRPKYIFLDEPTIGLDPISWKLVKQCLVKMRKQTGLTAVITGQDYEEMERLCQSFAILHRGRIVIHGRISEIIESYPKKISFEHMGRFSMDKTLMREMKIIKFSSDDKYVSVEMERERLDKFIDWIYSIEKPLNLKVEDYTLKEVFLSIVDNDIENQADINRENCSQKDGGNIA